MRCHGRGLKACKDVNWWTGLFGSAAHQLAVSRVFMRVAACSGALEPASWSRPSTNERSGLVDIDTLRLAQERHVRSSTPLQRRID
jgi:hypothetical protein